MYFRIGTEMLSLVVTRRTINTFGLEGRTTCCSGLNSLLLDSLVMDTKFCAIKNY
jgi:hypothetical protein